MGKKIDNIFKKTVNFLDHNFNFILAYFIMVFILLVELPIYIDIPGNGIRLNSLIEIEGKQTDDDFYMGHVTQIQGTIPTYILSLFNDDWDIVKKESVEVKDRDNYLKANKLLYEESIQYATLFAYQQAGMEVEIKSAQLIVLDISPRAVTNLKIGDVITHINNIKVSSLSDVTPIINGLKVGDKINITVISDGKNFTKEATLYELDGLPKIGIVPFSKKEYKTTPKLIMNPNTYLGGPSGGAMLSLSIYYALTDQEIDYTVYGTGEIDEAGNVSAIGGLKYKLAGADQKKAKVFFVPAGENYEEAITLKEKNDYKMDIIAISNVTDAIDYLKTSH